MKRDHQMTAPLEKEITIILTSIERGYHAVNLRSSAFICGLFLICASEYNYFLRIIKNGLKGKHSREFLRQFNFSWNKELLCIVFQPQRTQRAQSDAVFLCVLCALCGFSNQKIIKSLGG